MYDCADVLFQVNGIIGTVLCRRETGGRPHRPIVSLLCDTQPSIQLYSCSQPDHLNSAIKLTDMIETRFVFCARVYGVHCCGSWADDAYDGSSLELIPTPKHESINLKPHRSSSSSRRHVDRGKTTDTHRDGKINSGRCAVWPAYLGAVIIHHWT